MATQACDLHVNEHNTAEQGYEVEELSSDEEASYQNCLSIINEAFESAYEYSDFEYCCI